MTIPRIIHQTWKSAVVPERLRRWHETLRDRNPGWTFHLWSDDDNRALIAAHYPSFLSIYDAFPYPIMRVDAIRPFLLHHYGGVYADLDVECLQPLDRLTAGDVEPALVARAPRGAVGLVLGLEKRLLTRDVCANSLMASRSGHPFWLAVADEMAARAGRGRSRLAALLPRENVVLAATGPDCLDRVLRRDPERWDDALVLRPAALSPLGWWERDRAVPGAIAVHHYASTWLSGWSRSWQRIFRRLSTGS